VIDEALSYPSAPWRLTGECVLRPQVLAVDRVRPFVPPGLSVVPVAPGLTLGGVYLANYGAGSTCRYHELIVISAIVRRRYRVGAWVSHIYVDDPESLVGGREIWGLPKQTAHFSWTRSEASTLVEVTGANGAAICSLAAKRTSVSLPLPLYVPVLSCRNGRVLAFHGRGWCRSAVARCDLSIPPLSPIATFGLGGGPGLQFTRLNLQLYEPRCIPAS
jgi:acetoacetate decarboxylase